MDISYILTRKIQQLSHRIVLRRNEDLKSMGLTAEQADTLLAAPPPTYGAASA